MACSGVGDRKREGECGALADVAFDGDLTTMRSDDRFDDCQAEPRSSSPAVARLPEPVEQVSSRGRSRELPAECEGISRIDGLASATQRKPPCSLDR